MWELHSSSSITFFGEESRGHRKEGSPHRGRPPSENKKELLPLRGERSNTRRGRELYVTKASSILR